MAYTFSGGVRVDEYRLTNRCRIETLPPPKNVTIPLCGREPVVQPGDTVTVGQKLAHGDENSCPVHASVSGTVREIVRRVTPEGEDRAVVIENDMANTLCPELAPMSKKLTEVTAEEIICVIREAGITEYGNPFFRKIRGAMDKTEKLLINCCESEPFLTVSHRLMLEHPAGIINGAKILLKVLGVRTAWICIDEKNMDAIRKMEEIIAGSKLFEVKLFKSKYPQSDPRQLVYAVSGTEVSAAGDEWESGCVTVEPETCCAVYRAFAEGMPQVSRIITASGDCLKKPKNLSLPIGTSVSAVISFCGGLVRKPAKILSGSVMTGFAHWDAQMPVTRSTKAVLLLSDGFGRRNREEPSCIRCGKCADACPRHLLPLYIARYAAAGKYDKAIGMGALSCGECGCCAYVCPAGVEITQLIRTVKQNAESEG